MSITHRKKITCAGARSIARTCGRRARVPGWTLKRVPSQTQFRFRFTKRSGHATFVADIAGGTPRCIATLSTGR